MAGLGNFLNEIPVPDIPAINLAPWTAEDVRYTIQHMKAKVARGAHSWGAEELRLLSLPICSLFATYFNLLEDGTLQWPEVLTLGLITFIPKADNADAVIASMTPLKLRPITALPMWYRVWAWRTAAILSPWTASWIDPACCGCLPNTQCSDSTTSAALAIECTRSDTQAAKSRRSKPPPLSGFVLDLIKAFSRLPRAAFMYVQGHWLRLQQLQLWLAFLDAQVLRFKVQDALGEPFHSNCGCAEGDAISLLSMAWISHLWIGHLRQVAARHLDNRSFQCFCYADNWRAPTHSTSDTAALLTASARFCAQLRMTVAPQKCWIWCMEARHEPKLMHCQIDGRICRWRAVPRTWELQWFTMGRTIKYWQINALLQLLPLQEPVLLCRSSRRPRCYFSVPLY